MRQIILDIEANGLKPDTIWCVVAKEVEHGTTNTFIGDDIFEFADWVRYNGITHICGHNIIGYDLPILERLAGFKWEGVVQDTLVMSRLAHPHREGGHSLASWGTRLDFSKGDHNEWGEFSWEMVEYCKRDVELTQLVYAHLMKELEDFKEESITLEHNVARIVNQQVENGWTINEREANLLLGELRQKLHDVETTVRKVFKPLPVWIPLVHPRDKCFNKDGSMSKRYRAQLDRGACYWNSAETEDPDDLEWTDWGYYLYPDFNLGSRQQIGRYLQHFGWKPKQFTDKGNVIVNESVLTKVDMPEAQQIAEYLMLQKRVAQVQSWVDAIEIDGRVRGYVNPIGAVTGRMTHSKPNMAQVPASYSPYGTECRQLWTVPSGYKLVGMDASGLELRMLAHYMNDYDYTEEVISGDIHTANQKSAGLATRDQAKTFIYAFLYGAGDEKIGTIVGGGRKVGKTVKKQFLDNTPALKSLRERVTLASKRGYLIGLDGRRIWVRSEHSALNTLLQGAGAIIMKKALVLLDNYAILKGIDYKIIGNIHDEIQSEVHEKDAKVFGEIAVRAIKEAGEEFNLNCPLDGQYKVGETWQQTH
jgi:DNA polymerase I-like protein with 3'-5' exonuclease and polymerase domains